MRTTVSVLGMYNYDNSLFDDMLVPDGIDKELLIENIIMGDAAELELLYPNFDFLKHIIGIWSKKELVVWDKLYQSMNFEYEPIHNYDRTEEQEGLKTNNLSKIEVEKRDLQFKNDSVNSKNNTTTAESKTDTEGLVSGYNASDYAPSEKTVSGVNDSVGLVGEDIIDGSGSEIGGIDRNITDTGTIADKMKLRAYGNIGVTTTQRLIKEEREVVKFNIYDYIEERFKERFCLMVW